MDARSESFTVVQELGEKLIQSNHFASTEIEKHLKALNETKAEFER